MGSDNPDALTFDCQLSACSAPRLQGRQVESFCIVHFELAANEQGIAMPADASWPLGHFDKAPRTVVNLRTGDARFACANASIGFLKRYDVRVDLVQNG